jgi:hypothetical protein
VRLYEEAPEVLRKAKEAKKEGKAAAAAVRKAAAAAVRKAASAARAEQRKAEKALRKAAMQAALRKL